MSIGLCPLVSHPGMPAAYDLSTVIGSGPPVSHNNLIPLGTNRTRHWHSWPVTMPSSLLILFFFFFFTSSSLFNNHHPFFKRHFCLYLRWWFNCRRHFNAIALSARCKAFIAFSSQLKPWTSLLRFFAWLGTPFHLLSELFWAIFIYLTLTIFQFVHTFLLSTTESTTERKKGCIRTGSLFPLVVWLLWVVLTFEVTNARETNLFVSRLLTGWCWRCCFMYLLTVLFSDWSQWTQEL